ncbi:MAG: DUF4173 domain-containing protein [Bacteroidales bacterium]|nr:DUF4173 domain-containing protein [Bacteroidales bacterium]
MKKIGNSVLTLILAIIGSSLFYKQEPGINIFLFTGISATLVMLRYRDTSLMKRLMAVVPPLVCSAMIMLYPQAITFLIWMLAYLLMWSSVVLDCQPLMVLFHAISSLVESHLNSFFRRLEENTPATKKEKLPNVWIYIISGIIILIFVLLYLNGNPLFGKLMKKIDLSFLEFGFIMLTLFLYAVLYGMISFRKNKRIARLSFLKSKIEPGSLSQRDQQEHKIASISFWSVSVILAIVNLLDLIVILSGELPEGFTYKDYVHQGFYTLILAMGLAVALIVYFFRGQVNFHEKVRSLMKISYFWIGQNILLALITAYKNFLYVEAYGLTYKRIAVFLFVACVLIGLVLSLNKVRTLLSNWLFFNRLSLYAYLMFLLMAMLPYDRMITACNLNYAQFADIEYVLSLPHPDLHMLKEYIDENKQYAEYGPRTEERIQDLRKQADETGWRSWNLYLNQYKEAP